MNHKVALAAVLILLSSFSTTLMAVTISDPWIQGGLIKGLTSHDSQLMFLGKAVRVSPHGQFVIGMGRDVASPIELKETTSEGKVIVHTFDVEQRTYREQRVEGVPKRTVHIPEDQLPRIRQETRLIKAARKVDSALPHFLQTFIWPATGIISGVYGSRRYYNGVPKRPHYGVDIAAPQGSPVIAPASGVITLVHDNMYFSGGTIIMDHGHGISSTFIHLHKVLVKKGDVVKQGDLIAEIGSTGRSTGPHLHWSMNWFKERLDPQLLMGDTLPNKSDTK